MSKVISVSVTDENAQFLASGKVHNKSALINELLENFQKERLRKEAEEWASQPLNDEDRQWINDSGGVKLEQY